MNKLERFIMPIILGIGIIAILLAKADPDHVVILARVVGIILGVVLSCAFIFRLLGMALGHFATKKAINEMEQEIERLRVLTVEEDRQNQSE